MPEKHLWFNKTFRNHPFHFIAQAILIFLFMLAVLLVLMVIHSHPIDLLSAIGASALASSAFIVFAMPKSPAAKPYRVIGGYVCGNIAGILGHYIVIMLTTWFGAGLPGAQCFGAASAAAVVMLMMSALDFPHPPAMGLAIGLVIDYWDDRTLIVILLAALSLSIIKKLLHKHLISLA